MDNYYFTFGQNHSIDDVFKLHNYWVRVQATDYREARKLFILNFAIPVMGNEARWSFQYTDSEFKSFYFPKGEFLLITQKQEDEQVAY